MTDLTGKLAIVTGGARGQGRQARFIQLDVTDPANWSEVVELARTWCGRIDMLVNNAGIINRTLVETTSLEAWERVLKVNLTGAFLRIQCAADGSRYRRRHPNTGSH